MIIGAIRKLLITSLLILLGPSSVHAEPLRYSWKDGVSHVFDVEISTEIGDETKPLGGEITVTVKPYEPSKTRSHAVSASAVVISADGYTLTCAHAVKGVKDIKVTVAGREYSAERVYIDIESDLALLMIRDAVFQPAELAELNSVNLGQSITSIGFPLVETLGATLKVNRGIVSGITFRGSTPTIQIDAAVNPGNSGGPLFNDRGQVAAIVNTKLAGPGVRDVGFAVPIKTIREFLDTVRNEKKLEIGFRTTRQREPISSEELAKQGAQCVGLVTGTADAIGPGAAMLSYRGNFGESIQAYGGSSRGGSSRGGSRGGRGGTYFLRTAPNPIFGESLVDQLGEIYESKHNRQLPYLLGPILDLAIVQFPESETKSWTNSNRVQVNQNAATLFSSLSLSGWGFVARGDELRARPGTFEATETIAHREVERDEHRVVFNRDYSLRTNDRTERPTFSLIGKGQIEFDLALGVVRRHEMKFTLIQESENVTVRLPVSLNFTLVDPEVIEQRKREVAARVARIEAEKQAVTDAEVGMAPAARVSYYLTQFQNGGRAISSREWLVKLRDLEPIAEQHDLVTQNMMAAGLDPDSYARREALDVLERWATEDDIPKLLKLATASDRSAQIYVHGPALRILGKLKAESAVDIMLVRLKEIRGRRDATEALKLMGSAAEVKVLALLPEDDTFTRSAIFDVLSAIGTEKSIATFKELKATAVRSSDNYAIDAAVSAIEARLAAAAVAKLNPTDVPETAPPATLSRVARPSVSPTSLPALRSVIQELRAAETVVAKITAIKKLESLAVNPEYQAPVEQELHKYIQPGETALWPIIASALANWGTPASLEKLREMLKADGGNETLTILIVANLQRMDSREAAMLLLPMLSSDNPVIREQAISALSSVGKHVEPELIELLKSADEQLQYDVVAILRAEGTAASQEPLLRLRADTTFARVKEAARRAHLEILRRGRKNPE